MNWRPVSTVSFGLILPFDPAFSWLGTVYQTSGYWIGTIKPFESLKFADTGGCSRKNYELIHGVFCFRKEQDLGNGMPVMATSCR